VAIIYILAMKCIVAFAP